MIDTEKIINDFHFYKQIFNSVQQAVIVTDADAKIILWNKFAERLYGYTANEAIGKITFELLSPPELISNHWDVLRLLNKADNTKTEYYLKNKNGKIFPVRLSLSPLYNSDNTIFAFVGVSEDISDEKAKEKRIIESEKQYRSLAENFPNGALFLLDSNYQYRIANGDVFKQADITPDYVEGKKVWEVFPDIWEQIEPYHTAGLQGEKGYYEVEFQERIYSNQVIPVIFENHADNMVIVVAQDVTNKKKTEIELINNKEYFKAIFEQAAAGIGVALPTGQLINCNQKLADILGYTIEELTNLTVLEITFADDIEYEKKNILDILNHKLDTFIIEKRYIHKTGKIVWANLSSNVVRNENGQIKFVIAVVTDISERKKVETELILAKEKVEKNEQLFKSLIENASDGVVILDKNGKFKYGSPNAARHFGYTKHDVIGHCGDEFTHPDDLPLIAKTLETIFQNPKLKPQIKYRFKRKDGEYRWIETTFTNLLSDKAINGIILNFTDITERKRLYDDLIIAKEKAEENEEKFRTLFEELKNGVTLTHKGILVDINSCMVDMLGFNSKQEILGRSLLDFMTPQSKEIAINEINKLHANQVNKSTTEFTYKRTDGTEFTVDMIGSKIEFDNKTFGLSVHHDITERKLFEQELLAAKEKAEESDRLKSSFLQNISHEVRTPLNAISGFSQLIVKPNLTLEKQKKFSGMIAENSEKLIGIITDVIEISQIQSKITKPKLTEFDIIFFLGSIIKTFTIKAIEKNIDLQAIIDIPYQQFIIQSDKEKLQKILSHIIENAIKFTTQGSVSIFCELENKNIKFAISDTGIGISNEMQKVIFEPFRQVETGLTRNFGGNGLGLSLAKSYTELLNGSISLTSEINKGTTFFISIPTNKISLQTPEKLTNEKKYTVNTLLIVEDEYSNYEYLLELLNETKLKILYAANGQQAIDLCKENATIDLILMDIKMPIMDGHTAAKLIKGFRSDIPIIAQTAYALESERETFIEIFDDYITKPISEEVLNEKITKYMTIVR